MTSGKPSIATGSNFPAADTMRKRPDFSVINFRPSGKNAIAHGFLSPSLTSVSMR